MYHPHTLSCLCYSCADIPTETCSRFLDLTGPFQVGGVPQLSADFQMQNKNFAGCVRDVSIDYRILDLNDYVANNQTQPGCRHKEAFCASDPCANSGEWAWLRRNEWAWSRRR